MIFVTKHCPAACSWVIIVDIAIRYDASVLRDRAHARSRRAFVYWKVRRSLCGDQCGGKFRRTVVIMNSLASLCCSIKHPPFATLVRSFDSHSSLKTSANTPGSHIRHQLQRRGLKSPSNCHVRNLSNLIHDSIMINTANKLESARRP